MKSLGAEFIESLRLCKGVLWGVGGVVLSGLAFYISPTTEVSVKWLIPAGLVLGLLIHCLWDLAVRCHASAKPSPPRVVQGIAATGGKGSLALVQSSSDFYFEQFVAFFVLDGSFEVLVGVGYVANIQANGLILVRVVKEAEGHKKLWSNVRDNNGTTLTTLIVKSGAPKVFYDQISSNYETDNGN